MLRNAASAWRAASQAMSLGRRLRTTLAERGLLDEARRARAEELLKRSAMPMAELAVALGFADVRGLRRAFERWTGTTTQDARRGEPRSRCAPRCGRGIRSTGTAVLGGTGPGHRLRSPAP